MASARPAAESSESKDQFKSIDQILNEMPNELKTKIQGWLCEYEAVMSIGGSNNNFNPDRLKFYKALGPSIKYREWETRHAEIHAGGLSGLIIFCERYRKKPEPRKSSCYYLNNAFSFFSSPTPKFHDSPEKIYQSAEYKALREKVTKTASEYKINVETMSPERIIEEFKKTIGQKPPGPGTMYQFYDARTKVLTGPYHGDTFSILKEEDLIMAPEYNPSPARRF
jgi:hypothetical protein